MNRLAEYLHIPEVYRRELNGLRWSAGGEAVDFGDGSTFAFTVEVMQFLEGFASQRPLIHFGYILHLLYLLREGRAPCQTGDAEPLLRAYVQAGRVRRNAGVFFAVLCDSLLEPAEAPGIADLQHAFTFSATTGAPLAASSPGEALPVPPAVFEARILYGLSSYGHAELLHWFRHGRGPVEEAGEQVARAVLTDKPRSLQGVLADLARRQRLSGAVPFVEQLVSALSLPPRRLERPELPLGGYSDVTTRGHVEQILPSQFAFDDLEFVRRHAERELLYFRREEPHVQTREDLAVLLDQGVRTWGSVRLVLSAALFALGRLAQRRRIPFLLATTSGEGIPRDPLQMPAAELEELVEASDLSAHPALALERLLADETATARDIVLLTHPRNLTEPDVMSAARRLRPDARLFAVTVDEHGGVQLSAVRHGLPVCLSRFHVDLDRKAPPPPVTSIADPLTPWRGDVEPVGYPFRFGLAVRQQPPRFAFDSAGEWLLTAGHGGMLHATRTDGSGGEILPRGLVDGSVVADIAQVIGVAAGFVVTSVQPSAVLALHYNFRKRTCMAHRFVREPSADPVTLAPPPYCFYLRKLHTLVIWQSNDVSCLHLSTGSQVVPPVVPMVLRHLPLTRPKPLFLPVQAEPEALASHWVPPNFHFIPSIGRVHPSRVGAPWEQFVPLADGQPVLRGCDLEKYDCQGHTLAVLSTKPDRPAEPPMLRLFRGPDGIPLASFQQSKNVHRFALSGDGRLLAREIGRCRVEVRDVLAGGPPRCLTTVGRFHPGVQVALGERWLSLQIDKTVHLARWYRGVLMLSQGRRRSTFLKDELSRAGLPDGGIQACYGRLPGFLPPDPAGRFTMAAWNNLIAVVDQFGEVALFEQTGELVCMFFAFRQMIAAWMPDGTCHGPPALLGRPATPDALEKIGKALHAAWERGERTVV